MKTQEIIDIEDKYFINTFNILRAMSIWTSWQE